MFTKAGIMMAISAWVSFTLVKFWKLSLLRSEIIFINLDEPFRRFLRERLTHVADWAERDPVERRLNIDRPALVIDYGIWNDMMPMLCLIKASRHSTELRIRFKHFTSITHNIPRIHHQIDPIASRNLSLLAVLSYDVGKHFASIPYDGSEYLYQTPQHPQIRPENPF